jgi:exopolyphosphatase / guanosine-5'-triphosphate,3'-diphosphate pyrophosphatase
MYHRHDPIEEAERSALMDRYRQALVSVSEAVAIWNPNTLVGSSGTFDTLSEIYCSRSGLDYSPAEPETPLTVEAFWEIHQEIIGKDREGRMQIPGMIEMRVDMIVVASCLIAYLLNTYDFQKIRVSSYSLKEGVVVSLMSNP